MRVFFSTPPVTRVAVALALCTTIASTLAHAGQTKPAAPITGAERELLHQMGLEKYGRVDYRDVKGALITFAQFQALQPAFPSFGIEKRTNGAAKSAVISRQAAETAPAAPRYKLQPGAAFPAFKLAATDATVVDNAALHVANTRCSTSILPTARLALRRCRCSMPLPSSAKT